MAVDQKATRTAHHARLVERARAAGYRLPPLDAPPVDPRVAERIEIAMCRAHLGRKAGPRRGAC
ncbi:hypothetical protein OG730_41860 (plasmid) [Streptomyces sp. NBC_01298]|uniref:hypothetical protein n=1 Tax=Streptomyces sp. NBC_01298 TaxID=2903817 RepID=UPI002E13D16C|nr:hypothetical protein OG730_41860 [Streptomyces sp. NBC_01298]